MPHWVLMSDFLTRAKTLFLALPTWLTAIAVALTVFIQQADANGWADVSRWAAQVLVIVGVAIAIVRNVTPVLLPENKGLLPVETPELEPTGDVLPLAEGSPWDA